jgi:hypothetical protein
MRENIVLLVESILHRNLNVAAWMHKIEKIPLAGIFVILLADYFALTASGRNTLRALEEAAKDFMSNIDIKKAALQLAIVFALYLFAYSALLRADFSKVDEMEREHSGITGWLGWSRYLSEFLSILFISEFFVGRHFSRHSNRGADCVVVEFAVACAGTERKHAGLMACVAGVPAGRRFPVFFLEHVVQI